MSVSRDVIADAVGVPEGKVRCENCEYAERFINDSYTCRFWHTGILPKDAFCSFWKEGQDEKTD